jgi:hypothetical protein
VSALEVFSFFFFPSLWYVIVGAHELLSVPVAPAAAASRIRFVITEEEEEEE